MEIALSGPQEAKALLEENGWTVKNGHDVTLSFDSFADYVAASRGEFSVCKNVFVENQTGWFSDKSAAYLASGRPVILQDTGFSSHLPVGEGLFSVDTIDEAQHAIEEVARNYEVHSRKAREIDKEYLEARIVMNQFLNKVGI
jgi:hypothetical protein